ncbi:hypothetical protein HZS_2401 [Henneguya salminicola]|nr:hypothetical protein HZS_2401 [Henneguya salminicola]
MGDFLQSSRIFYGIENMLEIYHNSAPLSPTWLVQPGEFLLSQTTLKPCLLHDMDIAKTFKKFTPTEVKTTQRNFAQRPNNRIQYERDQRKAKEFQETLEEVSAPPISYDRWDLTSGDDIIYNGRRPIAKEISDSSEIIETKPEPVHSHTNGININVNNQSDSEHNTRAVMKDNESITTPTEQTKPNISIVEDIIHPEVPEKEVSSIYTDKGCTEKIKQDFKTIIEEGVNNELTSSFNIKLNDPIITENPRINIKVHNVLVNENENHVTLNTPENVEENTKVNFSSNFKPIVISTQDTVLQPSTPKGNNKVKKKSRGNIKKTDPQQNYPKNEINCPSNPNFVSHNNETAQVGWEKNIAWGGIEEDPIDFKEIIKSQKIEHNKELERKKNKPKPISPKTIKPETSKTWNIIQNEPAISFEEIMKEEERNRNLENKNKPKILNKNTLIENNAFKPQKLPKKQSKPKKNKDTVFWSVAKELTDMSSK